MSATTFAIAAAANATAITAEQEAHRALCTSVVQGFHNTGATVAQQLKFAYCVQYLNPSPADSGTVIVIKAVIVSVFIGLGLGLWYARRNAEDAFDAIVFGGLGAIGFPVALVVLIGAFYALLFLFSSLEVRL